MFDYTNQDRSLSMNLFNEFRVLKLPDTLTREEKLIRLYSFSKMNDLIGDLGWQEHTSDWDPYFEIVMKEKGIIVTASGFHQFEIVGMDDDTTICVDYEKLKEIKVLDSNDANQEFWHTIEIDDIAEIRLDR